MSPAITFLQTMGSHGNEVDCSNRHWFSNLTLTCTNATWDVANFYLERDSNAKVLVRWFLCVSPLSNNDHRRMRDETRLLELFRRKLQCERMW